eukprot:2264483-Rhodomonas_salina.1
MKVILEHSSIVLPARMHGFAMFSAGNVCLLHDLDPAAHEVCGVRGAAGQQQALAAGSAPPAW